MNGIQRRLARPVHQHGPDDVGRRGDGVGDPEIDTHGFGSPLVSTAAYGVVLTELGLELGDPPVARGELAAEPVQHVVDLAHRVAAQGHTEAQTAAGPRR